MSRYSGPRLRLFKRLGPLPAFGKNIDQKYQNSPKFNLRDSKKRKPKKKKNQAYFSRLIEKQKLRYHYGLTEKMLSKYVQKAQKYQTSRGDMLLKNLEMRLDNIVFRCGLTSTLPAARQLITHGHIFLNGKKKTRPSLACHPQDTITLNKKMQTSQGVSSKKTPPSSFVSFDAKNHRAKVHRTVQRQDVQLLVNELLVIEYYSRRNG
uniref:Small ribosomal subunit protein uS4c n=1 Tax=Pseudochlorodesmis sp. HV01306b TaxID=2358489 RepID=A0A386AY80_9CHLO|nr:ribosomal protein S4 [Pseudochlorodesmis sp. HV01306b]